MRRRHSPRPDIGPAPDQHAVDVVDEHVVVVPRRADPPPRAPFPLIGSLAPLGVAVVVWFVLHSPLALVFALLSPVMAVASLIDGRFTARKARLRNDADVARRRLTFRDRVDELHAREIDALNQCAPSARSILSRTVNPFTATAAGQPIVSLGFGSAKSSIRVEGGTDDEDDGARELRADALILRAAPMLAAAPTRIAVVGSWPIVDALARGYAVQLAAAISPDAVSFVSTVIPQQRWSEEWEWAASLPHSGTEVVHLGRLETARRQLSSTFVVVAESFDAVPAEATVVIAADTPTQVTVVRHPRMSTPFVVEGEFVSVAQAEALRDRLTLQSANSVRAAFVLPSTVTSGELEVMCAASESGTSHPAPTGLAAAIGVAETGEVFTLDLVEQGPHAVVAGTTGSGKSELLVTWVSALARAYDASSFTVLLVDFKGGAAFDPVTALDQCVGLITDLDPRSAERALSSLRAEVRRRERLLREAGARDIADARIVGRLPRLVIVVDEFAAMLSEFPQLHDVFADIAARGRSLGMHLVLCTQRPSGVVRDSLLANCELRLSLRVTNAADSTAIIGSPAASSLSPDHRGRCLISIGGRAPVVVQIARTEETVTVDRSTRAPTPIQAPWLPELPSEIRLEDLAEPSSGHILGLLDLPEEQQQPYAAYDPGEHGSLLVLGSARSGKSTLLSTIAHQASAVLVIGPGIEEAWDGVRDILALLRRRQSDDGPHSRVVVLVDDLDSLLRRFDSEYQADLTSDLAMILRDGPQCGITFVVSAQRVAAPLTALAPLFSERILLRFASRQEYVVAEGAASDHDPRLPPGAGHWRSVRMQVAIPPSDTPQIPAPRSKHGSADARPPVPALLLVVASRPARFHERNGESVPSGVRLIDVADRAALAAFSPATDEKVWLVGSPDAWIAAWTTFARLRSDIPVYFEGCSLSDFRSLTRRRDLPPPTEHGRIARWLLTPAGAISRMAVSDDYVGYSAETKRIS